MQTASTLDLTGANQLTVEFFYKPTGNFSGVASVLFEHTTNFNSFNNAFVAYGVYSGVQNNVEAGYTASGYHADRATGVPVDGWHHMAVLFDTTAPSPTQNTEVVRIFVEYVEVGVDFISNSNRGLFLNDTLFLGARGGTGLFYNGLIDQFRISDTLLNPSQFLQADAPIIPPAPEPGSLALLILGATMRSVSSRRRVAQRADR